MTLWLRPLRSSPPAGGRSRASERRPSDGPRDDASRIARVLVVEDDAALSDVVCTFLSDEGYACVPAFSGTEGLLRAESAEKPFDLVILDLMLPGIPGEELIGRLRQAWGEVPVVVTSAKSDVAARVSVLRLGADGYLVKPFDLEELLARVEARLRDRGTKEALGHPVAPLHFGRWTLDSIACTFAVDGAPLLLTRTEFYLLATLMEDPGASSPSTSSSSACDTRRRSWRSAPLPRTWETSAPSSGPRAPMCISRPFGASASNCVTPPSRSRLSPSLSMSCRFLLIFR